MSEPLPEILTLADGFRVWTYDWLCPAPRAVVVLVHGMMDHALRYADFAQDMADHDVAILAMDLPGHGHTAAENQVPLGQWTLSEDLRHAQDAITELVSHARTLTRGPVVLLGHSFGALLAQHWGITNSALIDGLVLSSPTHTAGKPCLLTAIGWIAARGLTALGLGDVPATVLDRVTFLGYNRRCQPTRTRFDWLDADSAVVNAYSSDPYCGFVCCHAFFANL
ncbi:MAG: alpha/beta hydrolase, partial [Candidatus Margulisiibacteriota bacterium]